MYICLIKKIHRSSSSSRKSSWALTINITHPPCVTAALRLSSRGLQIPSLDPMPSLVPQR